MDAIWAFLSDPENQKTLSWLGGGLVVGCGGLWAVLQLVLRRGGASPPPPSISADRGGIAAGGHVHIGRRGMTGFEVAVLVAVVAGALILAAAFAGTRIAVSNGVGVGGDIDNSTITIQNGGVESSQ